MSQGTVSLIVAILAAVVALSSISLTSWLARRERRADGDGVAAKYREPLLKSAHDCQSRLWNIQTSRRLLVGPGPNDPQPDYARESTMYVIAEFLAWNEIIRRKVQLLEPHDQDRERALVRSLDNVRRTFASTSAAGPCLRLFRLQQRAIGELLIVPGPAGNDLTCRGYAEFHQMLTDPEVSYWFESLRRDLDVLVLGRLADQDRLALLQNALVDLVLYLDPGLDRVAASDTTKLALPPRTAPPSTE